MKKYVFLCLALLSLSFCWSQTKNYVSFEKIWIENIREDKGIKIHLKFSIDNMKGKQCRAIAYFFYTSNKGSSSDFAYGKDFTPDYDRTKYNDMTLFIPYSDLGYEYNGESKHQLRNVKIHIYEKNTKTFISGNGSDKFTVAYANDGNYFLYWNHRTEYSESEITINCVSCKETGVCSYCAGRGGSYQYYYYLGMQWSNCISCFGSGKCKACGGNGYVTMRDKGYGIKK